jgi:hypothetical protein
MNIIKAFPTHVQFMKTLNPSGARYSLRLLNSHHGEETMSYLKEYSYLDFNSKFRTWHELDLKEQSSFIKKYTKLHETHVTPFHHPNSLRNNLNTMYNQNKDADFYFAYLYQVLKETADDRLSMNNDVVIRHDEVLEGLLFEK